MNGKSKCKILKEIRAQIAQQNDIEYVTRECTHQGDCKGTCPKCEAEVAYLERELEKRRQMGKRIAAVSLSAGMLIAATGCTAIRDTADDILNAINPARREVEVLDGEVEVFPDDDPLEGAAVPDEYENVVMGEPAVYPDEYETEQLEGDVAEPDCIGEDCEAE